MSSSVNLDIFTAVAQWGKFPQNVLLATFKTSKASKASQVYISKKRLALLPILETVFEGI